MQLATRFSSNRAFTRFVSASVAAVGDIFDVPPASHHVDAAHIFLLDPSHDVPQWPSIASGSYVVPITLTPEQRQSVRVGRSEVDLSVSGLIVFNQSRVLPMVSFFEQAHLRIRNPSQRSAAISQVKRDFVIWFHQIIAAIGAEDAQLFFQTVFAVQSDLEANVLRKGAIQFAAEYYFPQFSDRSGLTQTDPEIRDISTDAIGYPGHSRLVEKLFLALAAIEVVGTTPPSQNWRKATPIVAGQLLRQFLLNTAGRDALHEIVQRITVAADAPLGATSVEGHIYQVTSAVDVEYAARLRSFDGLGVLDRLSLTEHLRDTGEAAAAAAVTAILGDIDRLRVGRRLAPIGVEVTSLLISMEAPDNGLV